jgi:Rrf2 family protein
MKLSTKGRYGLRAMLDLALGTDDGPITTRAIAERQGISERYLEQLLIPLKTAGLVKSIRGSQGGYILGRKPEKITVGDIIRVLEVRIAPVECVNEVNPEECQRADNYVTRVIWSEIRDAIAGVLDKYSLQDLVEESQKMPGTGSFIEKL